MKPTKPTTEQLFTSLRPELPLGLASRIQKAVLAEEEKRLQIHQRLALGGIAVSVACFMLTTSIVGKGLFSSEFWQILSLIISDASLVLAFSQEFFYSLLETLPATALSLIIAPVVLFFISVSFWQQYHRFEKSHAGQGYGFAA